MKRGCCIAGLLFLVLAGCVGAEYLSTTVRSDGSIMLTGSGSDENGSFASRVMTQGPGLVSRSITGEEDMKTDLAVHSDGSLLYTDSASARLIQPGIRELCAFLQAPFEHEIGESSLVVSGILHHGDLDASRTIGPELDGLTAVNGSGMLLFGSGSRENRTFSGRGFVTGNMTVNDMVRYGGRV
ncbi:MAG: hypothetical protein LUQ50_03950 [Methanospirillum sp.]|nr:hypothetical protein [Methanospirillum sp.]